MATSLKDMLENGESSLSYNGNTPSINPQAIQGNATSIHSNGNAGDSYSLNGSSANSAQDIWNAYDDGDTANPLPAPSQLDIANGYTPGQYTSNLPEGVSIPTL
jgi:hypothetical protein